jgi:hypothetical protein
MTFKEQLVSILQEEGFDFMFAAEVATDAIKRIKKDPNKSGKLIIRSTGREINWKKQKVNPPPRHAHKIYDNIIAIEARKSDKSLWPGKRFRHDFELSEGKASIYGLPDGSLLITGDKDLWQKFYYD